MNVEYDCKSNINILILSAGRRVELVQCFKKAARKLNINSKIVAADMIETAPALYFADKFYIVPRIGDNNYIDRIIEICNTENIRLIVPTIDTELLVLSQMKNFIESRTRAKVLVSDYNIIDICRNKINTQKFFEKNGFKVPKQITEEDVLHNTINFPVIVKPEDGSSSVNVFKVNNMQELKFFRNYINKPIIQEMIRGEEYTVDVFLDFRSNVITIVPRIRLAVRSGEVLKGKIIKEKSIIFEVQRLMETLRPIGHITVQCMKTERGIEFIEINPRFGGGAPMSIEAGADSCQNLYKLLREEKLTYKDDYQENLYFLRYDQSIMLNGDMKLLQVKEDEYGELL